MPITFLCPACEMPATVPDDARGMSGVCAHCKLRLKVPTAVKFCVACHKDVANEKRVKDPHGFYYCEACYTKRQSRPAGAKPKAVRPAPPVDDGVLSIDDLPREGGPPRVAPSTPPQQQLSMPPDSYDLAPSPQAELPRKPVAAVSAPPLRSVPSPTPNVKLAAVEEDVSEGRANNVAKIVGRLVAAIGLIAVAIVFGWIIYVRVLGMRSPPADVWPESAAQLTDAQKAEINDDFKDLQDVKAMITLVVNGKKMRVNPMWWGRLNTVDRTNLIQKLSLYSQMKNGSGDVTIITETNGDKVGEKKQGEKPTFYEVKESLLGN